MIQQRSRYNKNRQPAAHSRCGRVAGLVCEEIVVFELQYVVQQPNLVRIKVPLPGLDLGEGAPGHVAAPELQLRCQIVLREPAHLPEMTYVMTTPDLVVPVHYDFKAIYNVLTLEQIFYFIIIM